MAATGALVGGCALGGAGVVAGTADAAIGDCCAGFDSCGWRGSRGSGGRCGGRCPTAGCSPVVRA
jgi:hypothetical protein